MEEENSKKIRSAVIVEVMGTPKDYVSEALKNHLEGMKNEKGIKIVSNEIKEPIEVKDQKGLYSTFSEMEIEANNLLDLTNFLFNYMPSHVEIIEPESLPLENGFLNSTLNEILRKLHGYDNIAKLFRLEQEKLLREIAELKKGKE